MQISSRTFPFPLLCRDRVATRRKALGDRFWGPELPAPNGRKHDRFDAAVRPIGSGSDLWHSLPRRLRGVAATTRPPKDFQTVRVVCRLPSPQYFLSLCAGGSCAVLSSVGDENVI